MAIIHRSKEVVTPQDAARWITFSGFWGSQFYLFTLASLALAKRQQPFALDARTALIGYGMHVGTFVVGGSLGSALTSLARGRSTSEESRERISSGALDRSFPLQVAGGALGSALPFALAVGSMYLASRITRERLPDLLDDVDWPQALLTMAVVSGVASTAVNRIASWVASDARNGDRPGDSSG